MTTTEMLTQMPLIYLTSFVMGTFLRGVVYFFNRIGRI